MHIHGIADIYGTYRPTVGEFHADLVAVHLPLPGLPEIKAEECERMIYSVLTEAQRAKFEEAWELDGSVALPGVSRFRLNVFRQKNGLGAVFSAMGLTFIAFQGYEVIAQCSEEVVDPRRNIPRAIFLALLIVIPIYLLVAFVSIGAIRSGPTPSWKFLGEMKELAIVEAAAQLPVAQNLNGTALENDYVVRAGFRVNF